MTLHSSKESILNLEDALYLKIAQTAKISEMSTSSASDSSKTLRPFNNTSLKTKKRGVSSV